MTMENNTTSIEWLEEQLNELLTISTVEMRERIRNKFTTAKDMYEQEMYNEYMKGYSVGWRECVGTFNNDVTILYNKYVNNR